MPLDQGEAEKDASLLDAIRQLRADLNRKHTANHEWVASVDSKLASLSENIAAMRNGFPAGDVDGHRRYHESVIAKLEARAKFYHALRTDLLTKGLWAVVCGVAWLVGSALYQYLKLISFPK